MKKRPHRLLKILNITLRLIKVIFILAFMAIFYTIGKAVSENTKVYHDIEAFKDRSVLVNEVEFEYAPGVYQTRQYHKVSRETSYELEDTRSVWSNINMKHLGQKGDIFVTHASPFPHIKGIHQFISIYFGGHAAIHNGTGGFIEATGFPDDDESLWDIIKHDGSKPHDFSVTASNNQSNYWLNPNFRNEYDNAYPYYGSNYRNNFLMLRVKNVTETEIDQAVDFGIDKADKALYNFLFFLDLEYKYYCTDLVSRAYQDALIEPDKQRNYSRALNDDGFITSVNDIILSKYTYICVYVEVVDNITHIYYLEDL